MKNTIALLAIPLLAGCAAWPHTNDPEVFLAAPADAKLVRFDGTVAVPLTVAYRNIVRAARRCWSRSASIGIFAPPIVAQGDLDPERLEAVIEVSTPGGNLYAVVKLTGKGEGTLIHAAAVDAKGGLPGSSEIPLLPEWAAGRPTACGTIKPLI